MIVRNTERHKKHTKDVEDKSVNVHPSGCFGEITGGEAGVTSCYNDEFYTNIGERSQRYRCPGAACQLLIIKNKDPVRTRWRGIDRGSLEDWDHLQTPLGNGALYSSN